MYCWRLKINYKYRVIFIIAKYINYFAYGDGARARHLLYHCGVRFYQLYSLNRLIRIFHPQDGKSPLARLPLAPQQLALYLCVHRPQWPLFFLFFSLISLYIWHLFKVQFKAIYLSYYIILNSPYTAWEGLYNIPPLKKKLYSQQRVNTLYLDTKIPPHRLGRP